jgi:Cd2+/Zn2+-exporting ATPase
MESVEVETVSAPLPLKLRIEGMDCASCALKIENAMKRLPGVSDINVSYGQESLTLKFDEDRTSVGAIEEKVRALGFTPVGGPAGRHVSPVGSTRAARSPWWSTRKARLVAVTGALFVIAAAVAQAVPTSAQWAWSIAAIVTILPFARRAWACAVSGTPFSIETLMSVAALGALLIGAAEEAAAVIFLFALGEMLEGVAAGKARAGIEALVALVPRDAWRERDGAGARAGRYARHRRGRHRASG